jgi:hypothetical protein
VSLQVFDGPGRLEDSGNRLQRIVDWDEGLRAEDPRRLGRIEPVHDQRLAEEARLIDGQNLEAFRQVEDELAFANRLAEAEARQQQAVDADALERNHP